MATMRDDILERLRADPGHRTLGQLIQDREAAVHEIVRLRSIIDGLRSASTKQAASITGDATTSSTRPAFQPGSLIRLADVCRLVGLSRSSIYKRLSDNAFPQPVRLGPRTVRWRIDSIEEWRDSIPR
jgi:prophage regulatory protein